jgi:hypothetical protein
MRTARWLTTALSLLLAAGATRAADGDDTLRYYLSHADLVVLGEFTSEPEWAIREEGVVNYGADFKIARLIKGKELDARKPGGTIRANVVRLGSDPEDRPPGLKKGGKCILFIKCNDRQKPPSYITADVWFGVQPPLPEMADRLARLARVGDKKPAPPERNPEGGKAAGCPVRPRRELGAGPRPGVGRRLGARRPRPRLDLGSVTAPFDRPTSEKAVQRVLCLALVANLLGPPAARAEILPTFAVGIARDATDVVLVRTVAVPDNAPPEGRDPYSPPREEARFEVVEPWKGKLKKGDGLSIAGLGCEAKGEMVLFLRRNGATWLPASDFGGWRTSVAWLNGDKVAAVQQPINPGPAYVTAIPDVPSRQALKEEVMAVVGSQRRKGP